MRVSTSDKDLEPALPEPRATPQWLERLGERVGLRASAATVFGEPVERDGVTVVPVARAMYGFGGGSGQDAAGDKAGGGGGGGAMVRPAGFIEIAGGRAVYRPLRDPVRDIVVPAAAAWGIALAVRALRRRRR